MKLFSTLALALTLSTLSAQELPTYQLHRYDSNDGGILWGMSDNGRWGVIRLGSESAGGTATPKLYDTEREEAFEVTYQGQLIHVTDVSDDGQIVVGSLGAKPVAYNRATGQLTRVAMRPKWQTGILQSVSPDGRWAVGYYNGFNGQFANSELTGEFQFSPLMVDLQTGDTLALPGLPKLDMAHSDEHATMFMGITPDGRYAIGQMDWFIMQPISGFTFIYDTHEHTYRVIGFDENARGDWRPHHPDLHHIEGGILSPNGRYVGGLAYITKPQEGSQFFNEYGVPFRYDLWNSELKVFDDGESNNISVGAIDDQGTIIGNPDTGSPLRNFRVLYKDRYWIPFSQICQQYYGFDFYKRTGYEYTGSAMAISADGSRFISFPDPTGESYLFDLGRPIEEVCASIDLLSNYTTAPQSGATFSLISNVEINFGRSVQVLGNGRNVHLVKADGTKVIDGLSNGGLTLKTGSKTTVVAAFRPRPLDAGTDYFVVIDAGAIAVSGDAEINNHEIRIPYHGRRSGAVSLTKAAPADGSTLRQIDNTSSYILLDFDAPIQTTDQCLAYIERTDDGTRLTTLNVATSSNDASRHQLLLTPATPVYLYNGEDYRVIVEAGSVSDYSADASSHNERIELTYHGSYVREVTSETVLFADDFNSPNASLTTWLMYEGDQAKPNTTMQSWGFDQNNTPWNFSLHDTEGSTDYFAGSHSNYSPAATSDDWMMTPQLAIPSEGKTLLDFDAQSYDPAKKDYLSLYVYESHDVLSHLTTDIMKRVCSTAVLLDSVRLSPGATSELTADEWTHFQYDLSRWAGRDIYIAFVNRNRQQSAIFVDNVLVQREILYSIGFTNRDRVIGQESIDIAGQFTVMCDETAGSASLTLRDASGQAVSTVEWAEIPAKGTAVDFAFAKPLALTVGTEVPYTIDVRIGSKADTYTGLILDLAFEPVKRVVLEEMTGSTCVNCPLGIVSIEHCQQAFGDRFIPVAIHSYTGDNLGASFMEYSSSLGLIGAPMARINRLPDVYSPMFRQADEFYYRDVDGEDLWYDVVARELNQLTMADLDLNAQLSADGQQIEYKTDLRYALTAHNQQLSLFVVVLEDGIQSFQQNGFYGMQSATLADWCNGGPYATGIIYPYTHDHVVRSVIGQTYSGTIGMFPADLTGGVTYSASFSSSCPQSVIDASRLSAVAMLIDTQTGQVINAAHTAVTAHDAGITAVEDNDSKPAVLRTLSGTILHQVTSDEDLHDLPAGIYLLGGKKVWIR